MAHPVVNDWVKTNFPIFAGDVQFIPTEGMLTQQKGLPSMWFTIEYDNSSNQKLSVGKRHLAREYGTATAVFLVKSGSGPDAVLAAAQAFADAAQDHAVAAEGVDLVEASGRTGKLRLENISPPNGEPYEDGNWLVCSVSCVYTYDSVRGAVG